MVSTLAQVLGVVLIACGAALLWSAWALVIGGAILVVVPEIVAALRTVAVARTRRVDTS